MYLNHFGLTDSPFKITPHTEVFFEGAQRGAILDALVYAVTQGEGLIKVTGEVGTGKTMLCRMLAERLPASVETIYLAIPSLTRDEMLGAIAEDLGLGTQKQNGAYAVGQNGAYAPGQNAAYAPGQNAAQLLRALQTKLIELHESDRRVVVLIDEAHAMPLESLEEIRLLSNLETNSSKLLQIVLFGQPELDAHLALKHMRQLKERITQHFKLAPLSEQEVHQYLHFRLRAAGYRGPELFDPKCTKLMARASQGLSRRINIIADKSLLAAFADNTHNVAPNHIKAAIRDSEFQTPLRQYTHWISAAFAIFGAIAGATLMGVWTNSEPLTGSAALAPSMQTAPVSRAAARPVVPNNTAPPTGGSTARGLQTPAPDATQASSLPPTPARDIPVAATKIAATQPSVTLVEALASANDAARGERASAAHNATAEPKETTTAADAAAWEASRAWMQAQPGEHWVIQLMLSDAVEQSERAAFIAHARGMLGEDKLHQYPLQLSGSKKIGVLYGAFPDRQQAQRALLALPFSLKQYQPYMRTVGVVRQEATYN